MSESFGSEVVALLKYVPAFLQIGLQADRLFRAFFWSTSAQKEQT